MKNNAFTKEVNKIALSSNYNKRMQSIDYIEAYVYRISKDLVSDKEEIKCNNIRKRYKKWKKKQKNIIKIDQTFLTIHKEY